MIAEEEAMIGKRVEVVEQIDRFPHFVVPVGTTGKVIEKHDDQIFVEMDVDIPGAGPWDNIVHFSNEDGDNDFARCCKVS